MKNNKCVVLIICVIVLVLVGFYLVYNLSNSSIKRACEENITYSPSSESETVLGKSKIEEHYVFTDPKKPTPLGVPYTKFFKTKKEAVSYCVGNKLN